MGFVIPIRLVLFTLLLASGYAAEAIQDYSSLVEVLPDATLRVTETIAVRAEGREIRHGIYREFPTLYHNAYGLRTATPFDVVRVQRDGRSEPWHSETRSNGIRIYIGDPGRVVPTGTHFYEIEYRTSEQLGFFADHDELFWNVTGNGWVFPIERASAEVRLPAGAQVQKTDAFTGPQGSHARNATATPIREGIVKFATSQPLAPQQGLTVLVTWQKGIVTDARGERLASLAAVNLGTIVGSAVTLLAVLHLVAVFIVYRRPVAGGRTAQMEPPAGVSPAAVRFLYLRRYDRRCMAVGIMSLAEKGALTISQIPGKYQVHRGKATSTLTRDEAALHERLFAGGDDLTFQAENAHRIAPANESLKVKLTAIVEPAFLVPRWGHWWFSFLLSAIAIGAALYDATPRPPAVFVLVVSFVVALFGAIAVRAVRQNAAAGRTASAAFLGFATLLMAGMIGFIALAGSSGVTPWITAIILANVALIVFSFSWLRRPTPEGWRTLDQIAAFRRFLAGRNRDAAGADAKLSGRQLGRLLPYAVALDVERLWGRRLTALLANAGDPTSSAADSWADNPTHFARTPDVSVALGAALTTAIASSCSTPGSDSSGGGGGDSGGSGGGGGGGGGGGW